MKKDNQPEELVFKFGVLANSTLLDSIWHYDVKFI